MQGFEDTNKVEKLDIYLLVNTITVFGDNCFKVSDKGVFFEELLVHIYLLILIFRL